MPTYHLTFIIPIKIKTTMAIITAPKRPKKSQPPRNAITETTEILDQSIVILFVILNHNQISIIQPDEASQPHSKSELSAPLQQ